MSYGIVKNVKRAVDGEENGPIFRFLGAVYGFIFPPEFLLSNFSLDASFSFFIGDFIKGPYFFSLVR